MDALGAECIRQPNAWARSLIILPIAYWLLPIAYSLLAYSLLPIAYCLLAYCLWPPHCYAMGPAPRQAQQVAGPGISFF